VTRTYRAIERLHGAARAFHEAASWSPGGILDGVVDAHAEKLVIPDVGEDDGRRNLGTAHRIAAFWHHSAQRAAHAAVEKRVRSNGHENERDTELYRSNVGRLTEQVLRADVDALNLDQARLEMLDR
jgi:hypothetical protein